ncbi:MAG: AI-2E family transporter [Bryobacterales bacterium]|nr:AI-2E family transporter [Bryobacterales bacterium]
MVVQNTSSTQKSLQLGVGILAAGAAIALLYFGRVFFITVIIASMIAFLLDPLVLFFMKLRMPRALASFVVCSMGLICLYLAGVGIYLQGLDIADDLPAYGTRINEMVDSVAARMEKFENGVYASLVPKRLQPQNGVTADPAPAPADARGKRKKAEPHPPPPTVQEVRIQQEPTPLFSYVYSYLAEYYSALLMTSFVPFLVYFLLSWRDHLRNRYLMLFQGEHRDEAAAAWHGLGDMVRAYVIGNFLLGILLTVASGLLFASVKLPYWIVVAPVSGFLSLVPYIGLPLALAPPLVAALPATKDPAIYLFLAMSVAILHLLALNLLYPKFVGARVHLNPLAVTVALMFWGMLWGAIGLVLAIPLTAGLKAVCDHVTNGKPYSRLLGD